MDLLYILFGIAISGWIVVTSLKQNTDYRPADSEADLPPNQSQIAGKVVEPFDGSTQTPVPAKEVLVGSAYVIDGDSIVIQKTQIRLFGIDAPELNHPYGQKAKWALVRLCKGHKITAEILAKDDHGRTVAKCRLPDGKDLSEEMITLGLAIDWPKYSGGVYARKEVAGVRKRLWLADARQKGRMHVWEKYEARQRAKQNPQ